ARLVPGRRVMHGYHGRLLRVDLSQRCSAVEPIEPETLRAHVGGVGLATYLLNASCPPGADPLGPANPLVFAASPFVGTGITTAAKLAVATRSPQTGMIGDSLSSSYLAISLKRTGHDALVLHGAADAPTLLVVDDDRVHLEPADDLLGLDPMAAAAVVR